MWLISFSISNIFLFLNNSVNKLVLRKNEPDIFFKLFNIISIE